MASGFTTATITHTFTNADGTAASGTCKFSLTGTMTNGTKTIVPASLTASLDGSGNLSQALTSNVDMATWTLTSTASSGTFTIGLTGSGEGPLSSAPLNSNATAAQVQAAILAIPTISGVTCAGGPLPTSLTVSGVAGNLTLSITSVSLAGGTVTSSLTTPGSVPAAPLNTRWRVDINVLGASEESYFIVVPAGGGTYDLGSLLPTTPQVN